MTINQLVGEAEALLPEIIDLRRAIHAAPEIGLFTPTTTAHVRAALDGLPLELREGPSTSGIVARLKGAKPGKTVLLRGDMDALPVNEETGLEFASKSDGMMHACGHDGHTAMLVGAAKLLCNRRNELAGDVLFMFQPGEEGFHGARHMIDDGLLNPLPDAAFALHLLPNGEYGVFTARAGPILASFDNLSIAITGTGGHASMPHNCIDPIPVACEIVMAIQQMVTRRIDVMAPAVVTIGSFQGGNTFNVIPDSVQLKGTLRTVSEQTRHEVQVRIRKLAATIAEAHDCSADVQFDAGYPVTVNAAGAVDLARATVTDNYGDGAWRDMPSPIMGAEDFSYVLSQVSGAFIFLGAAHEGVDWLSCCGMHSARMVIDESVMARGSAVHAAIAMRFLEHGYPFSDLESPERSGEDLKEAAGCSIQDDPSLSSSGDRFARRSFSTVHSE